jgi:hypothetical protein
MTDGLLVISHHDDPTRQYLLDDDTGVWRRKRLWPCSHQMRRVCGFGGEVTVKVIHPESERKAGKMFLALYAHRNILRFRVAERWWDVTSRDVSAHLTTFESAACFELERNGSPLVSIEYDPATIWTSESFLAYATTMLADSSNRDGLVQRWEANAEARK